MNGDQRPGAGHPEPEPRGPEHSRPEHSGPEHSEPEHSEPEHSRPEHQPEPPEKSEPGASHGSGMRAVFAALGANLGIAVVKFAAFLITGSASMLAESV